MRRIYEYAGWPYKNPHAHRHGHATYMLSRARDMGDYKAISQNLMHADMFITDRTYAILGAEDIGQRYQAMGNRPSNSQDVSLLPDSDIRGRYGQMAGRLPELPSLDSPMGQVLLSLVNDNKTLRADIVRLMDIVVQAADKMAR